MSADADMKSLHLLYHELRTTRSTYSYVTPREDFDAHCALFAQLRQAEDAFLLRPEITFDDGNLSDLALAQPILDRHGLHGTFFITAGWTERRTGFLTWSPLRELQRNGHRVGAHGMTHKLLTECTRPELNQELEGARKLLEDGLGTAITSMSLPGGRANKRVLQACEEAGYKQIFTSRPRAEDLVSGPRTVGRLNLVSGTTPAWLQRVLDPRTGILTKLERGAELKELAKRLLGDHLYARLWAIGNRQETHITDHEAPIS